VPKNSSIAFFLNVPPKIKNEPIHKRSLLLVKWSSEAFPPSIDAARR
jgi:hypothetical protein